MAIPADPQAAALRVQARIDRKTAEYIAAQSVVVQPPQAVHQPTWVTWDDPTLHYKGDPDAIKDIAATWKRTPTGARLLFFIAICIVGGPPLVAGVVTIAVIASPFLLVRAIFRLFHGPKQKSTSPEDEGFA